MKRDGITNIIKKDIANINYLLKQDHHGGEIYRFMNNLQEKGYIVRFQVNESNQLMSLFFCHESSIKDARKMPEAIIIDATYKTNNHKLTFINIVGTSSIASTKYRDSLQTFAIAGAWVSNELGGTYNWVLEQLRSAVWPLESSKLPDVFITDNETALRNALDDVFPEVHHLLCYWHLGNNLEANFRPLFAGDSKSEISIHVTEMRDKFHNIVHSRTENEMNNALEKFDSFVLVQAKFKNKDALEKAKKYFTR